jgi:hypothetical protein
MSGILDKKQRLIDFILTSDGYTQIENGDLRFVYATLVDKDAIYERKQGEFNIADLDAMPFSFEANSNFFDKLNVEIDLKQTANFELRTEIDGQYIDLRNNEYKNSLPVAASIVFDKITNNFTDNLIKQRIILTDTFFNLNYVTQKNDKISLLVNKINKDEITLSNSINSKNEQFDIKINSLNNYYTILNANSLNLSKTSMIEDDRFQNKLNYLFLPPTNMNKDVISKNNKINNFFNLAEDKRNKHKIIFKKFSENADALEENTFQILKNFINLNDSTDNIILESINILKNPNFNVGKFELKFEKEEYDTEFVINLTELNSSNDVFNFNKLIFINHGEIFDKAEQKNVQIYSAGKLINSKTEIDLDNIAPNNFDNGQYINEDNYLFINLFTIVIE